MRKKRVFRSLASVVALLLLLALTYLFGWSSIFSVKKVTIALPDSLVAKEIKTVLDAPPAAITIGEKLARVDKRVINARLRTLLWVDKVSIRRNFINGEVRIGITPRDPIAKLSGAGATITYLSSNLEFFTLAASAVKSASSAGAGDWGALPILRESARDRATLEDIKTLITAMAKANIELLAISAPSPGDVSSSIKINGKKVEILWGSVQELELKERVLEALLAAPENKSVKRIDLSDPINPTVR